MENNPQFGGYFIPIVSTFDPPRVEWESELQIPNCSYSDSHFARPNARYLLACTRPPNWCDIALRLTLGLSCNLGSMKAEESPQLCTHYGQLWCDCTSLIHFVNPYMTSLYLAAIPILLSCKSEKSLWYLSHHFVGCRWRIAPPPTILLHLPPIVMRSTSS